MNDEQDSYNSPNFANPAIIVATTVATLVLAGSAVFWRSNLRHLIPHESNHLTERQASAGETATKSSRAKERRRRGKDPMKELMKGGKKGRDIARLLKTVELSSPPGSAPSTANSILQEPSSPSKRSRSRDQSSSRSVSSASAASSSRLLDSTYSRVPASSSTADDSEKDLDDSDNPAPATPVPRNSQEVDDDFSATPRERPSETALPSSSTLPTIHHTHSPATSHDSTPSLTAFSSTSSESLSTAATSIQSPSMTSTKELEDEQYASPSTSNNTRRNKNKKPNNNHNDSQNAHLSTSRSLPSASSSSPRADSNIPSPSTSHNRKPPRFRSKSRQTPGNTDAFGMSTSVSMPVYSTSGSTPELYSEDSSSLTDSRVTEEEEEDYLIPITFPTLNGPVNGVSDPFAVGGTGSRSPAVNGVASASTSESASGTGASRHPTPRHTPTPSRSGTSTPPQSAGSSSGNGNTSLSTQTQIASLRGALEAARMREEKSREQLDKVSKEVEMLRWEGTVWRRREAELHTQIRHLMHQLHAYAPYIMSMQQTPTQHQPHHHWQVPSGQSQPGGTSPSPTGSNNASSSSSPSPNGYAQSPLPASSQQQPQSSTASTSTTAQPGSASASAVNSPTVSSPSNGLTGLNRIFSPPLGMGMMSPLNLSSYSSPHSPFFPYPVGPTSPTSATQASQGTQSAQSRLSSFPPQVHPTQFMNMGSASSGVAAVAMGMGMGFGLGINVNGFGSGSVHASSSTSSVGSEEMSPDGGVNVSPSPGPRGAFDRGRRRGRARAPVSGGARDANNAGSTTQGESGEDWVAVGVEDEGNGSGSGVAERYQCREDDGEGYNGYDEEEDGEVNELLAGAILKRPESIRLGSGRRRTKEREKVKEREERDKDQDGVSNVGEEGGRDRAVMTLNSPSHSQSRQTEGQIEITTESDSPIEFTFPSISDWGNAYRANSRSVSAKTKSAAMVRDAGVRDSAGCGENGLESEDHHQQQSVSVEPDVEEEREESKTTPPAVVAVPGMKTTVLETPIRDQDVSESSDASIVEVSL